ncbi:B3 domain-containing protein [Dichanthelium oligosanthes]|uniref:B3 domain-containing protein n=1 Tax=Dichanthelium oligosanthes TaxID=888268 RepID=A0A1E5UPW8_9POAL|nr:B3 domain-containing protein [Dichanthelium oligosanthes]
MSAIFFFVLKVEIAYERSRTSDVTVAAFFFFVLKNAEGKTWPVVFFLINGRVFLTTGWPIFFLSNCLGKAEFLVLVFFLNMHFKVSVFGVNGVEKAVWPSGSGAQATVFFLGEQPCDIFPSSKIFFFGDELTKTVKSLKLFFLQVDILDHTQVDVHVSFKFFFCFHDLHEVGCSKDELETCLSQEPMEDDKAFFFSEVMRTLHVDKLAVELFCATLCLYNWKVDAAAEDLNICRGKPQIFEQSLKQKLVFQFFFVKKQLQCFFPPVFFFERIVGPNLSNQPLFFFLTVTPVKRRLVDVFFFCDLSHQQKRRIVIFFLGSPQTPTPRRSPLFFFLNNTCNNTNKVLIFFFDVLKPQPAAINQVFFLAQKSFSLHEKPDIFFLAVREETTGSLSQDLRKLDFFFCEVGLSKEHEHDQFFFWKMLAHSKNEKNSFFFLEINSVGTSDSFMFFFCIESSPNNSGLTAYSRKNELSFTWKHSQHFFFFEKIVLDMQRDNFFFFFTRIQKIIRDDPSDVLSADVIEAVVRIGIFFFYICLQDRNAQKIVFFFLEYAKKVKEKHNFFFFLRKEEFSGKLQDLFFF